MKQEPAGQTVPEILQEPAEREEDPVLARILDEYRKADAVSVENAEKYRRILAALSVTATLLAVAFLLYDEVYLYWLIVPCILLLLALFAVNRFADRLQCHKNYLEYRLYAEGLRVQSFLRSAGIRKNAADLLPWAWRMNVPWTVQKLQEIPGEPEPSGRQPVLDLWIRDQKDYHREALARTELRRKRNDRIVRTVIVFTVLTYAAALVFESLYGGLFTGTVRGDTHTREIVHIVLKVMMGSFSCMTLFAGSYYGKLSLEETAGDHRRMIALYEQAESQILEQGETEEILLELAKEELGENSSWYAYQSKNRPDISF